MHNSVLWLRRQSHCEQQSAKTIIIQTLIRRQSARAADRSHDPTQVQISDKLIVVEMRVGQSQGLFHILHLFLPLLVCFGSELLSCVVRLNNHTLKLNELLFFVRCTGTARRGEITQVPTRQHLFDLIVFFHSEVLDNFKMVFRAGPTGSFCSVFTVYFIFILILQLNCFFAG